MQKATLLSLATLLTGCGANLALLPSQPGSAIQGRVHGGQQPVTGATISLYAAGSLGNGIGATDLLAPHVIQTDAAGGFNITGDYTCPTPTTQVYAVARGGNPGLAAGAANPALVMAAALGDCGSLSSSTFIYINEVTTVAAAWSLDQFLGAGALAGASSSNATGLRNAFANAANLANTANGTAPGATLPYAAIAENAKLYTLADVLVPCINSDGTAACAPLFALTGASNTLDAALAIARNPGTNVGGLYALVQPQPPFQPALPSAPYDWTLTLTFGACASGCGGLNDPSGIAFDSTGSLWVANYIGGTVSRFLPNGTPAALSGYPGAGLRQSYGITVDPFDNAWVTNQQSVTAAGNAHYGSISKFSSAGVELSGYGYTAGGIYYPQAPAADSAGNIWVANYGNSSATLLDNSGAALSPSGYAVSALNFTLAVALDASSSAWFAVQAGAARVTPAGAVTKFPCCSYPSGVAISSDSTVWLADYSGRAVTHLDALGNVLSTQILDAGNLAPQAVAVDGAATVWTSNYFGNSISHLSSTGALLSPAAGFGQDAPLDEPYGIAVDASGNLWLSNADSSTLTEFIGIAAPVRTPNLGPPTQP